MKPLLRLAPALVLALAGCSAVVNDLGAAGKAPGELSCKGRAIISGSGSISVGLGLGGSNEFRVAFDCSPDGAFIRQGMPPLP